MTARPRKLTPLLALTLLAALVPASARAATLNVPDDFAIIQAAIDAAASGDVVLVKPGTYHERLSIVGKALSI